MQSILKNSVINSKNIISLEEYNSIVNKSEYILYADNILEGITLLNNLTINNNLLTYYKIVYSPIDQPIYLFKDKNNNLYSIKICGAYEKWQLPKEVSDIINFIDLPDYILYSITNCKVILAGENTETASVGNSQWQREGRKLGAAKLGVPFIYQTFYSGIDESQSKIREPSSLQVYNHLVYSVRYKTPSFVAYFENNFPNSGTRIRKATSGQHLMFDYIKSVILCDANNCNTNEKNELEKKFFKHMIDYLRECKSIHLGKDNAQPRLLFDLPSLKKTVYDKILYDTDNFVDNLVNYLYETNQTNIDSYLNNVGLLDFDESKFEEWTSYSSKLNISEFFNFIFSRGKQPLSYVKGSAKVGFVDALDCKDF